MAPFKLRVRVGSHSFAAEGPEESVKEQYRLFLQTVATHNEAGGDRGGGLAEKPPAEGKWTPFSLADLRRVFQEHPRGVVSLRTPLGGGGMQFDTVLVLIYGIQAISYLAKPEKPVPKGFFTISGPSAATASQLIASAKLSGLDVERIDRMLLGKGNLVYRGGAKRGSVYCLLQPGREHAEAILRRLLGE